MNVSLLRKLFLALLFCWGVGGFLQAQGVKDTTLQIFKGSSFDYQFTHYFRSHTFGLSLLKAPSNGSLSAFEYEGGHWNTTYTPSPDFVGLDSFTYTRLTCASRYCIEEWTVYIQVVQPRVEAEQDIAFAEKNSAPVPIYVLSNDYSTTGVMNIVSIPMVNNGTATLSPDGLSILFTPAPDFEGIANFNYSLCDDNGNCDKAVVNVLVGNPSSLLTDTLTIFTSIDEAVPVLVPPIYTLTGEPQHGAFMPTTSIPYYHPDPGFTGTDFLDFTYSYSHKVFRIEVLPIIRNQFAHDDKLSISPGSSKEIDVLANDFFGNDGCVQGVTSPKYGSISYDPLNPGVITYHSPEDFTGIDEFTYTNAGLDCSDEKETATVAVYVSRYEPAYSKFFMSTPKLTPLVIGYSVPIQDFKFEIYEQAKYGQVVFMEGHVDTVVYGQTISGYNLVLYIPDPVMASGIDEFELTYCLLSEDGFCKFRKGVKVEITVLDAGNGVEPMCFQDCIWAGDTNFDGIVNLEDLLPIGLTMGEVGTPREESGMDVWYGRYGEDWSASIGEAINIKHVDTNGDSLITAADTVAISKFYGRTHSMTSAQIPNHNFNIRLEGDVIIRPGEMIELDMYIGSEERPAIDFYGFTFNLPYNPRFFDPEQANLEFLPNSWMTYNSPVMSMTRNITPGLIESAFTRTNGISVSGFGPVGKLRFVVIEDIHGIRPDENGEVEIVLGGNLTTGMNSAGQSYGVRIEPFTIRLKLTDEGDTDQPGRDEDWPVDPGQLKLFPNPVGDVLNLHLNGGASLSLGEVFDITGRRVLQTGNLNDRTAQIDVSQLPTGAYVLRVQTDRGPVSKRFEVVR